MHSDHSQRPFHPARKANELPDDLGVWLQNTICAKARRLKGRLPHCLWDREDLEGDLWEAVLRAMPRHDRKRGPLEAFLICVIRNRAESIARRECASKRRHHRDDSFPIEDAPDRDRQWIRDLRINVHSGFDRSEQNLRTLAEMLMSGETLADYARYHGFRRGKARGDVERLKRHLRDRGLDPSAE